MPLRPVQPVPPPAVPMYAHAAQGGAASSGGGGGTSSGPAFRAYQSTAQSIPGGTSTQIQFQTEVFDTDNAYDPATGRFQPPVSGYYFIEAGFATGAGFTSSASVSLFKNGSIDTSGEQLNSAGYRVTVTGLIFLNGTTDYVDARIQMSPGSSGATGTNSTYFMGFLARSA